MQGPSSLGMLPLKCKFNLCFSPSMPWSLSKVKQFGRVSQGVYRFRKITFSISFQASSLLNRWLCVSRMVWGNQTSRNHNSKVPRVDKVHQQSGALVINGHFVVVKCLQCAATNKSTKLSQHLCHSFPKKTVFRDLQHTKPERMAGLAFRSHFYITPVHKDEKPGVPSSDSAPLSNEKIWTWMNLYEEFWISACKADFHLSYPSKGEFLLLNEHSFRLWQHLKKARICFQSKMQCCPPPPHPTPPPGAWYHLLFLLFCPHFLMLRG